MKLSDVCKKYGLERVAEVLESFKITTLYPPQSKALKKGALEGKNLVLAIPTASGKTLIAELCMLRSIFQHKGKCLYIVPLRALASEKYEEFKRKYERLGVKVGVSTGDLDFVDPRLAKYDILVATSEKVDSLLRHRARWLAEVVSVVVLDEVHLLNDPGRGPTLEILATRLRQVNPELQVLALSATVGNSDEIAEWLGAELVESEWRPVPLRKGVFCRDRIRFDDKSKKEISARGMKDLAALVIDTLREGGQVLVFVNTRRSTQSSAEMLSSHTKDFVEGEGLRALEEIAGKVERALGEPTGTCRLLANCIRDGVAFHHAGLHHEQRRLVEESFRRNLTKVICATPTLAAGVNLPARRVVIRDYRRYVEPYGSVLIPVLEFHQFCGRAGRPQYDEYGEAVLIARDREEEEALFEEFIFAPPERIVSKLATEPALRTHVLASIAAEYVRNKGALLDFMGKTFFAYQFGVERVEQVVERILDFLEREELIRREGGLLSATPFGERVSSLYIDPLSAVLLRNGLANIAGEEPTPLGLLHLVSSTPDMPTLYLGEGDSERMEEVYWEHEREILTPVPSPSREPEKFEQLLAELKTAAMLEAWIEEEKEEEIHKSFGVGAGDIRRLAETAEWLLYSAHELAKLFKTRQALTPLRKLRSRVRHGVKEELLELVQLRGIGRVRGRSLFNAGYRKLKDLEAAEIAALSRVPYIGRETARSIKAQLRTQT
jgi:helicase